jgi:type IV pilus assembly protein PilM
MAQSIKKATQEAGIKTKQINIALAENQVYTKVVDMPALSDRELASAIYWEAEQYIPIPIANITLVWNVLDRPKKFKSNERMKVLMVGAPTALVDKYKKIIGMAGFSLNAMETEILATIRALTWSLNPASFPTTMIVNIGAVSTSLAIVKNGILDFTYGMQLGGAAINRAIATDFGLTQQQAEEYKKVYGVLGKSLGGKVGLATQPILMSILSEMKKAIAFFNQKSGNQGQITQILLSGGTARLPGIDVFFANNSGIETAIANPWQTVERKSIPQQAFAHGSDYTIAAGLAMREYE